MPDGSNIAVLGAGAWGTALATRLVLNGHHVTIWGRDEEVVTQINNAHTTPYLKDVRLPNQLTATTDIAMALNNINYALVAVPSGAFAEVCDLVRRHIDISKLAVAWATKGIDPHSHLMLDRLLADKYHVTQMALISGPSFALEVAQEKPTAINIVSHQVKFQTLLADDLSSANFRIYKSSDLIGSQICAIYKNVLAIAAGVCDGMGMGYNARAALLTRGLEEMRRLVLAMGGQEKTVYGLCGLGDLLLTATGDLSRNRKFGLALAEYDSIEKAANSVGKTIEGKANVDWLLHHAKKHHLELPICGIVSNVLQNSLSIAEAAQTLLTRGTKH